MSDSSEDEDMSKFKEVAVDSTFLQLVDKSSQKATKENIKSERYLEKSSHYNDFKVPKEMQKQISAKISAIIEKNIEFVNIPPSKIRKKKIKGGIKLFKGSSDYLSCEAVKDVETELHNINGKKLKRKRCLDDKEENERIQSAVISGDYIQSKEETKLWKSRRKEKLYKYKSNNKGNVLTAIE